jgi:glycosyltransferase involved in cell wall biosynthesis
MSPSNDKPLLTFGVAAFNQERFIEEAVRAAFAQTYSPLEIVLSDDCSKDRTFEIMREMAASYKGPHQVILNRNPRQRSIGGHVNRLVEVSNGELIITAAGDDISLPERAQVTYEAWEASGRRATSLHANIFQIDENGREMEQVFKRDTDGASGKFIPQKATGLSYVRTLEPVIFGCAHAFSRKLYTIFGDLPDEVIHEDNSIGFRSAVAGQFLFINVPLVKYRVHGANVYIAARKRSTDLNHLQREEDRVRGGFRNRETMYRTFLLDLEKAREQKLISKEEFEECSKEAARMRAHVAVMGGFLESNFFRKCGILLRSKQHQFKKEEIKTLLRRLPPKALVLRFRLMRAYASLLCARKSDAAG